MSVSSDRYPSIQRIAELQQFIADFAKILRMPQLADTGRAENDVEHSYSLALTCWFLAPKIAPELNLEKIFCYALVHDLVEIHAGDTNPFGSKEAIASKHRREKDALKKITKDWPDFPQISKYIECYERLADNEAVFVYGVDKILPSILVNLGEKDKHWKKHKITLQMHIAEKEKKLKKSSYIWPYHQPLIDWLTNPDYFYRPPVKSK